MARSKRDQVSIDRATGATIDLAPAALHIEDLEVHEPPEPAIRPGGPPVNETFVETDVRQALQSLSAQAGVSFVVDDKLGGVVTAYFEEEPLEAALEKILSPLGCVFRRVRDTYYVGLSDPGSSLFGLIAERSDYFARHESPDDLVAMLPERFAKFVRTSEQRNRVIIEAPRADRERIEWELRLADRPVPQVILEAIVVVYSPEDSFRFGFDFEQGFDLGGDESVNFGISQLALGGLSGPARLESLRSFTFTSGLLRAMAREGYVSIRAAPRVMAKDGEKARINIGRETFFSVQPDASTLLLRQDLERVQSGITLDITPVIRGDRVTVTLERAEVSEDIRNASGQVSTSDDRFPTINRRAVSTTVHVRDGETIVIGGLVQKTEVDRVDKVPLLGDMPGLGMLFRQVDRQYEEAEVSIFISPRIVRSRR